MSRTYAASVNGETIAINDYYRALANLEQMYEQMYGQQFTPEMAQQAHAFIRSLLPESARDGVRIQYGGSMKPENAAQLLAQPDIDGGLIGGASLDAAAFAAIVGAAPA